MVLHALVTVPSSLAGATPLHLCVLRRWPCCRVVACRAVASAGVFALACDGHCRTDTVECVGGVTSPLCGVRCRRTARGCCCAALRLFLTPRHSHALPPPPRPPLTRWHAVRVAATGRLFQVEYAMQAINHAAAAIGIRCADGVIIAGEKKVASVLLAPPKSSEKMYKLDDHVCCAVAGLTADANTLIRSARIYAQQHRYTYSEVRLRVVTLRCARSSRTETHARTHIHTHTHAHAHRRDM